MRRPQPRSAPRAHGLSQGHPHDAGLSRRVQRPQGGDLPRAGGRRRCRTAAPLDPDVVARLARDGRAHRAGARPGQASAPERLGPQPQAAAHPQPVQRLAGVLHAAPRAHRRGLERAHGFAHGLPGGRARRRRPHAACRAGAAAGPHHARSRRRQRRKLGAARPGVLPPLGRRARCLSLARGRPGPHGPPLAPGRRGPGPPRAARHAVPVLPAAGARRHPGDAVRRLDGRHARLSAGAGARGAAPAGRLAPAAEGTPLGPRAARSAAGPAAGERARGARQRHRQPGATGRRARGGHAQLVDGPAGLLPRPPGHHARPRPVCPARARSPRRRPGHARCAVRRSAVAGLRRRAARSLRQLARPGLLPALR